MQTRLIPTVVLVTLVLALAQAPGLHAATVFLRPVKDTSLFLNDPAASSGAGLLFAGRSGVMSGNDVKRALVLFDVAGSVPVGALVQEVGFEMNVGQAGPSASSSDVYALHRLVVDWGEAGSFAFGGAGGPAEPGDATWSHRFFTTTLWVSPGGDFISGATASAAIPTSGLAIWDGLVAGNEGMVDDVQYWLDNPAANHGWIVRGEEGLPNTARSFDSKDTGQGALLFIKFDPNPPEPTLQTTCDLDELLAGDASMGDDLGPVAVDGDTIVAGAPLEDSAGADAGKAYAFFRGQDGSWSPQALPLPPGLAAGDGFGSSVAVDGDTAVVGSPFDDGPANSGTARVYVRSAGAWAIQATLTASDAAANDNFGEASSVDADTAVIGAPGAGTAGKAYAFGRTGANSWCQQSILSGTDAGSLFGASVAVDSDTLVVGAPSEDGVGGDSGAAYVYIRDDGGNANPCDDTWTLQERLEASDAAGGDLFGEFADIDVDTIVLGAPTQPGTGAGQAYVYVRNDNGTPGNLTDDSWLEQFILSASDGAAGDRFGAVAVSGDTVVVGAGNDEDLGADSGSAYIFTRNGLSWSEADKLTAPDGSAGDQFGALAPSIDGGTIVVSAASHDEAALDAGAAYVFGFSEVDSDDDAVSDACDACPLDDPDDTDADGVCDSDDACPGFDDTDDPDGDGIPTACDVCPLDNPNDTDGDGVCDSDDACPLDNPDDTDGDGACDSDDLCPGFDDSIDADGDGVPDGCDPCPLDNPDDTDGDGVCESVDICPGFDDSVDPDGDGVPTGCDACPIDNPDDTDGDGVCESDDICPGFDDSVDPDGDGVPTGCDACPIDNPDDTDGDGVCDSVDICPGFDDSVDPDGDGVPTGCDACPIDNPDDTDGDGVCESDDICPGFDDSVDPDGDGVPTGCDACPIDNPDDTDGDSVCDSDDICPGFDDSVDPDGDGVPTGCDACPIDNPDDTDGDGVCESVDICPGFDDTVDPDGDGVPTGCDACPIDNPDDTDGDSVCDSDDICPGFDDTIDPDGDGVPTGCDACPIDNPDDTDGDGVCDSVDICPGFDDTVDPDGDGVPTGCDACPIDNPDDTDGDGVCDSVDICPGFDDSVDPDGDGVPTGCDACPIDNPDDTDGDGVCDSDDICPGFDDSVDPDGDSVPTGCDACPIDNPDDTDGDSVCDSEDICPGFDDSVDPDGDGVPTGCDACPIDNPDDTDGDGVCDSDDICPGFDDSVDPDGDGVPTGCDACPIDNPDDTDGDSVCDSDDICPGFDDSVDPDGDGVPTGCDACPIDNPDDTDGDGVCDSDDACPGFDDTVDPDGDGIPSACDLCPDDIANDPDRDGFCEIDDCDEGNGDVWATPGEALQLTLTHDAAMSSSTLQWQAPAAPGGSALTYSVAGSSAADDFVTSASCLADVDATDTQAQDPDGSLGRARSGSISSGRRTTAPRERVRPGSTARVPNGRFWTARSAPRFSGNRWEAASGHAPSSPYVPRRADSAQPV